MPGAQYNGHKLPPVAEEVRRHGVADARRYRELEKEDRELKTLLADSLLKIRALEEGNAKSGKPSAQAPRGGGGGVTRAVFAAEGLSVLGAALIELSVSIQRTERLR